MLQAYLPDCVHFMKQNMAELAFTYAIPVHENDRSGSSIEWTGWKECHEFVHTPVEEYPLRPPACLPAEGNQQLPVEKIMSGSQLIHRAIASNRLWLVTKLTWSCHHWHYPSADLWWHWRGLRLSPACVVEQRQDLCTWWSLASPLMPPPISIQ